jgi:serine phosphatase RsbU (regulator of sigma subunit)
MTRAVGTSASGPPGACITTTPFARMPNQLRAVAGDGRLTEVTTAGRCFPSGLRGEPVAGDFFDVFTLDEARTLIAVGDVVGHGLAAATRMEALRADNRALALLGLSVAEVLRRLDLVQCGRGLEELATLWLGIYDCTTDCLDYASAGHLPPVLAGVEGGRATLLAEASAPPLGSGEVGRHVQIDRVPFPVGALLVAYTDGLIERADLDLERQIEALRRLVEQVYEPECGEGVVERLVDQMLRLLPQSPLDAPDDVCILAVHRSRA